MCSDPQTIDGNTVACRKCNECIATRRAQWEARAMMERTLHPFTLAVDFTYDESTQHNRDARAMFQYQDVRDFMSRLRAAARYADPDAYVRFIFAGEQGDRTGHCHWHAILYSNVDPATLGVVQRLKNGVRVVEKNREDMLTVGTRKRRLNWSLWPHGFVTFKDGNYGAAHYVLSYCIADQFTEEKSHGTMREAKAANFSTGLFRMSKRPAIGEPWLWQKFERLDEVGAVLPHLNFNIPGLRAYYHPSGSFREKILWSLRALNQRAIWATGRDAPQWSTLLSALQDNPHDMEILIGPPQEHPDDFQSDDNQFAREVEFRKGEALRRQHAYTCGRDLPCGPCLTSLSDEILASLGCERVEENHEWRVNVLSDPVSQAKRQAAHKGGVNRYCQKLGSKISRHTFPASDPSRAA